MPKIKEIKNEISTPAVKWIHLNKNDPRELEYLKHNHNFHPLDLADCASPAQRPKIEEYDNYFFMVLIFPYYDRAQREILPTEVDFFIGPNYLITISDGKLAPLNDFWSSCREQENVRQKFMGQSSLLLLSEIINKIQHSLYPMLDHISEDIHNAQTVIFSGYEKKMVKEILMIRRNIISYRKIMQAHKNVIKKLISKKDKFFVPNAVNAYLNNNLEQTKDLWDILEGLKENIDALHSTNESLISFRLNDVMKMLTIISVILLPANLIAVIFGMKTLGMPLVGHPYSFWIVLCLMLTVMTSFIIYFKNKRWL